MLFQRPPLRDLPLDRFITNPNLPQPSFARPSKRPRSPDRPSQFSPTKRRILADEGVFSPDKTVKSPFRGRPIATPVSLYGVITRSAAKKLDSGAAKNSESSGAISRAATPARNLAPSPELSSSAIPSAKSTPRREVIGDDYFSTPERVIHATPTLLPRELPPACDPRSIHYPGFKIHRDPHIVVLDPVDLESLLGIEKQGVKENLPPKKKCKKSLSESPILDTEMLLTPGGRKREMEKLVKAKATPATPKKTLVRERLEVTSPTPRRPSGLLRSAGRGTPLTAEEKKQRRKMLQEEAEEGYEGYNVDDCFL
ncbi:hypothetical protein D9758_004782 [Tetrapyrgos nigripes]|uniref:Uncharacterized protein n=1 Tax=Tetrapyrgos nigripes TaxID=182062 RepID=A0A8H5LJ36_9AGAR|nr:hypothetical protein D9758_004782 [Tetrapyrgos nigripes]